MNELTISPEVNKGIKAIKAFAYMVVVDNPDTAIKAGDQVLKISKLKDAVEGQRTEFTKPLNESLRSINAFFKQFSEPLEEADAIIRNKIITFKAQNEEALKEINTFGVLHFTNIEVVEVVDIKKVPREYMEVDMVKVKKAIAGGIKIPGIKVNTRRKTSL
jgi:hypothetical protein